MSKNILGFYQNGNYMVTILEDGTKIRASEDNDFIPSFAENCDVKITDYCDGGCEFCYEGCSTKGKHGNILNAKFLDTLHPYTELAINGNDLSHPDLIPFLEKLKEKKIITNMTVNQKHFIKNYDFIKKLTADNLIYGVGVSLVNPTDDFIDKIKVVDNAVIHVINGIFSEDDAVKLQGNNLKLLVLGYKHLNRGISFYDNNHKIISQRQKWMYDNIDNLGKGFKIISYDNLAVEQLDMKRFFSEERWEKYYMGDEGTVTFYIDLVKNQFSKNSISQKRYELLDSIDDMFSVIISEKE